MDEHDGQAFDLRNVRPFGEVLQSHVEPRHLCMPVDDAQLPCQRWRGGFQIAGHALQCGEKILPAGKAQAQKIDGDRQAALTIFLEEISPLIRAMVGSDVDFIAVVKRFLHRLGVIASAELAPGLAELSEARSRQVDEHFEYVIARQTADVPR
jgi:hypothetical protein